MSGKAQQTSGKPTISATAVREDVLKFIKENKIQIKITENVDGKRKKRSVKALREELNKLGYAVTGNEKPPGKVPTTLKGLRKAQGVRQAEDVIKAKTAKDPQGGSVRIQIQGFSSETKPPAPQVSGQEVELMGAISGKLSAEQEVIYKNLPPAEEIRGYLSTRLALTSYWQLPLRQLKLLYMKEKAKDNQEVFAPQYKDLPPLPEIKSYLREQLPSVNIDTLTLVGIKELYVKTKPKVDEAIRLKAEEEAERQSQQAIADRNEKDKAAGQYVSDTDEDEDEEIEGVELISFEGVLYQYIDGEEDDLYNLKGDFVGQWNVDYDDINFINEEFSSKHDKDVDDYQMGIYKQPARKKPIRREKPKPEPEPELIGGFTEEEIETLIELAEDTSRYLPVRRDAWRQLRDAGIHISEPKEKPKPKPKPKPATPRPAGGTFGETLDTDDDTEDEEPEMDTTSEEEEDPEQWTDFEYEGVQYSYQDGLVYDESLNAIGEARIRNRMFIKWTDKVQEYHRRKVAAIADPDNEDDSIDFTDMWKYTGELEDFDDDL
jgi:hypothetical protein